MPYFLSTLPIGDDYQEAPRDGRQVDFAGDGMARIRKLHADRFQCTFSVPVYTAAAYSTLFTHYAANSVASFTFTSVDDGNVYTVAYAARPTLKRQDGMLTASVTLTQTA